MGKKNHPNGPCSLGEKRKMVDDQHIPFPKKSERGFVCGSAKEKKKQRPALLGQSRGQVQIAEGSCSNFEPRSGWTERVGDRRGKSGVVGGTLFSCAISSKKRNRFSPAGAPDRRKHNNVGWEKRRKRKKTGPVRRADWERRRNRYGL